MLVVGIEPTIPYENRFLRPARMPVPPHQRRSDRSRPELRGEQTRPTFEYSSSTNHVQLQEFPASCHSFPGFAADVIVEQVSG